jgi:hypothetical protein
MSINVLWRHNAEEQALSIKMGGVFVLLLLLIGALGVALSAQDLNPRIEISPLNPVSNDNIVYRLSGIWPNGCVPQSPKVSVSIGEVRIRTSNPDNVCAQVTTPWTLMGLLGELAPGGYSLIADYSRPGATATVEIARTSFSVAPSTTFNEVILPIIVNGAAAEKLHYQTIFTILNTTTQSVSTTLQVYSNAGTPGGVFCSPLAPPPSSLTATLDPGELFLRFTSADLPFHNGWARLIWDGPSSLLVSEELTLVAAPPSPCLLICNRPSTEKISSMQLSAMKPAVEFRLPITFNPYRQTALALINPSASTPVNVRLSMLDGSGKPAQLGVPNSFDVKIGPLERISKFLWQMAAEHSALTVIFPIPESFQGSLVLTADNPFAVGAINFMFPEGKFVSIPIFAASR